MKNYNPTINFVIEIDKLKSVFRQSLILDASRRESVAEHSWHLAMAVILLETYSNFNKMDMAKAIKMALVHDIVEIDAGDTYAYDPEANKDKLDRELKAAERIYGILPDTQQDELKNIWKEFEARESPEAKYVDAVDRFIPILINYLTEGRQWKLHKVSSQMVLTRNSPIEEGSSYLWNIVNEIVSDSVKKGYLF